MPTSLPRYNISLALRLSAIASLLIALPTHGQVPVAAPAIEHGQTNPENRQQAWDSMQQRWLAIDQFWLSTAEQQGGLTWGSRDDYPPYEAVQERDTLIIITENGPCMMEFFHTRWRRANDVRRWDDAINNYQGCATVFD